MTTEEIGKGLSSAFGSIADGYIRQGEILRETNYTDGYTAPQFETMPIVTIVGYRTINGCEDTIYLGHCSPWMDIEKWMEHPGRKEVFSSLGLARIERQYFGFYCSKA